MTAFNRLRCALETNGNIVRDTGSGKFNAQCPAHDDRNPSLSVTAIEGSVLLHCHSGCDVAQVLDSIGWTAVDLYDNPRGAEYPYPGGRRVHRTPAKKFSQSGNRKDRSLFHADRIGTADDVLVVEGEKDVLAAEAAGAAAVCPAMGAGKAARFDWTPLAGKRVTVVADDDAPGRRHAAEVVEQLVAAGAVEIRVVGAAVGKDLADHIAAGRPLEDLVALDVAPPPRVTLTRLSDVTPERVQWLWRGYVPRGKLVTLDGDPGLGKSTLAITLAAPITTGSAWPDGTVCEHQGAVLLLSAEDGLADTVRPRLDAAGADVTRVHNIEGVPVAEDNGQPVLRPPTLADVAALEEAISSTGAVLLIVDVVMAYLPAGTDSHKDQDIRRVLSSLSSLADRTGCTVLLIRHLNKASGRDPLYRGGGSIGIVGAARAGLLVAADPDDPGRRVLASVKSNLGPAPESMAYRLIGDGERGVARVEWEGATTHTARDLLADHGDDDTGAKSEAEAWLADYLTAAGAAPSKAVKVDAAKAGIRERTLQRAVAALDLIVESRGFPRVTWWRMDSGASDATTPPGTQNLGATGATGPDQQKHSGATGPKTQSRQVRDTGATEPPGGITAATKGMTPRVERALAAARASGMFTADPPCYYCDRPVASKTQDTSGRYVHLSCQPVQVTA